MKVLYFHQHFSTPSGKTGTRSYEFARKLIERGHEVTMVCGSAMMGCTGLSGSSKRGTRRGTIDGINIIEVCIPYSNSDSLVVRSFKFLKFSMISVFIAMREKHDILFATSTPLTAGIPGIVIKLLMPWKIFIFEVRDLWPELPRAMGVIKNPLVLKGMSVLEKMSYITMNGGIALSPGIMEGMQRRSSKNKVIEMIPNGCDLELFKPYKKRKQRLCQLVPGLKEDDFVAIFTGAHGMANGLDAVLDAAKELSRKTSRVKFIFIGDGKLKPGLIERTRQENIDNCFFLDPVSKIELAGLMNEVDVGLMILANVPAFYYGTSPNKFFDYISLGLPVLNNYPGWLADMIREHNCGIAVPPDNPFAFSEELYKLSCNPEECSLRGINARRLAEKQFNRNDLAMRFVNFLESIKNLNKK